MGLKIEYKNPAFPDGTEFDLGGILVINGQTTDVDDDAEHRYVSRNRLAVREGLAGNSQLKVTGDALYSPKRVQDEFPAPTEIEPPVEVLETEAAPVDGGDN